MSLNNGMPTKKNPSPHPEWYMQDVGLASGSGEQQTYAALLCARWSGRSYWHQDLYQGCGFEVMHIEIQATYLVSRQIAYDLRHLGPAPFPQPIVVQGVAVTALLAT
jgi:hypothetical protein